jgi:hypothetical protein
VRDSAEVQIFDIDPGSWPPREAWRIEAEPSIDIGVAGGDPAYELYDVRGVAGLPDGRVVVAEGNATLRFYDSLGRHLVTSNLRGPGPGEAQAFLGLMKYRQDSVLIITERLWGERSRDRLLILDRNGSYGRDVRAWYPSGLVSTNDSASVSPRGQGVQTTLSDGTFIVVGRGLIGFGERREPSISALLRLSPEGELMDTLATVRVGQYESRPNAQRKWEAMLCDPVAPPPRAHGGLIFFTSGDRWVVDVFTTNTRNQTGDGGTSGELTKSYRIDAPRAPITSEYREQYIETIIRLASDSGETPTPPGYRERLQNLLSPDSVPAIQDLRVDSEGFIWVEPQQILSWEARMRFRRQGVLIEKGSTPWIVLDPEGELIGLVRMPPGLDVVEIGEDHVLGLWTDGMGIQHVRRHHLNRTPPPP